MSLALGLFADRRDVDVRRKGETWWSNEKRTTITRAGRSYFGKLFARYHDFTFELAGAALRFVVEGGGDARVFVLEIGPASELRAVGLSRSSNFLCERPSSALNKFSAESLYSRDAKQARR